MKTRITTLPVYDSTAKQCFERAHHAGQDNPVPITCPRHRLPSMQWLDDTDGATTITGVWLLNNVDAPLDISGYLTLPGDFTLDHDYFSYNGAVVHTILPTGVYYLHIITNNAKDYYSDWFKVDCVYEDSTQLPPTDHTYSTKFLIIDFHNDCDLGDILYHHSFTQTIWLESEPLETSFPMEEEGMKNGEGRFIRTFARQVKKYTARTKLMPDYMVDIFNRLKLHDTVTLIDLVGDTHTVYNLEVEHEWFGDDKYYAKIDLTFDYNEAVVVSGCCNNIT